MADFAKTITAMCRGNVDLSVRQIATLLACKRLAKDPKKRQIKELAVDLGLSKPATTRAADKLHDMAPVSLVARSELPNDRRTCVITLTAAGEEMVQKIAAGWE